MTKWPLDGGTDGQKETERQADLEINKPIDMKDDRQKDEWAG